MRTVFSDCTPSTAEPMSYTNTDTNDCTKDRGIKYKKNILAESVVALTLVSVITTMIICAFKFNDNLLFVNKVNPAQTWSSNTTTVVAVFFNCGTS